MMIFLNPILFHRNSRKKKVGQQYCTQTHCSYYLYLVPFVFFFLALLWIWFFECVVQKVLYVQVTFSLSWIRGLNWAIYIKTGTRYWNALCLQNTNYTDKLLVFSCYLPLFRQISCFVIVFRLLVPLFNWNLQKAKILQLKCSGVAFCFPTLHQKGNMF